MQTDSKRSKEILFIDLKNEVLETLVKPVMILSACSLCSEKDGSRSATCFHRFCEDCLEDESTDFSECPICQLPLWRKDITKCPLFSTIVESVKDLGKFLEKNN